VSESDDDARVDAMVRCPECGASFVMNFRPSYLSKAFESGDKIRFYAACHDRQWDASEIEVDHLRRYFTEVWLPQNK
jgi:hypothetical protein